MYMIFEIWSCCFSVSGAYDSEGEQSGGVEQLT